MGNGYNVCDNGYKLPLMFVPLLLSGPGKLSLDHWIAGRAGNIAGDKAAEFSRAWRDKQLEYAFRRGLMQNYENFDVCASQALDYR